MLKIFEVFIDKIKHVKVDEHLTSDDIAKLTGYKKSTIDAFMCGSRPSEHVAEAISQALNIEI